MPPFSYNLPQAFQIGNPINNWWIEVSPYIFFFFDNTFDSDVCHNFEENICRYFRYIAIL